MPLTRLTLRQLEAFAAVAELQSFAGAGQRLGLTSSAVSQLVAELEMTTGFRVFDRSTRRVSLSSAGRDFLPSALTVLRHMELAESAAGDVRNRAAGVVRIGAPLVLAGYVLPRLVREFRSDRPKVTVRIRDVAVDQLVETVEAGDVDLAIGPDRPHGDNVLRDIVMDDPWVLWCSPSHPLAERQTVPWSDLRGANIVAAGRDHERSVARMRLNAPEDERIGPVEVVGNVTTALGLAAEGLAVTLAPAYIAVLANRLGLVSRRVTNPETIRHVCLYRSNTRSLPPAAAAFGEFILDQLRSNFPNWKKEFS